MRTLVIYILTTAASALFAGPALGQPPSGDRLVTRNSAGVIKLGMKVADVRRAVAPMKVSRTVDAEGIALVAVKRGKKTEVTIYAGQLDQRRAVNDQAVVEEIQVWDRSYRTAEGIGPGSLLSDAEKVYGPIKTIMKTQIESREFVEFRSHPPGIEFRMSGGEREAGIYAPGKSETTSYHSGAYFQALLVTGKEKSFLTANNSEPSERFSSVYTDLAVGCTSSGGVEGGHVSTYCSGPGKYRIHYFDTATTLQFMVQASDDDKEEIFLMSQPVGIDLTNRKAEWRLADGEPFAVIIRKLRKETAGPLRGDPSEQPGEFLVVKGLKGFEEIGFEIDATQPNANIAARAKADEAFVKKRGN